MLDYLSNLLPRLRKYSENLDKKEIFIDQSWVVIEKGLNKQQYIFERNGRLLVSVNGDTQIGKWEYISAAKSLLIHVGEDHLMLKQDFISKGVVVLRKDAVFNEPVILANQAIVPNLNVEWYLKRLLQENANLQRLTMESGVVFEYEPAMNGELLKGTPVYIKDNKPKDGIYKVKEQNLYVAVEEGLVRKKFSSAEYLTDKGPVCINIQDGFITIGDYVYQNNTPAADDRYKLKTAGDVDYFEAVNGRITVIEKKASRLLTDVLIVGIAIAAFLFLIYLMSR